MLDKASSPVSCVEVTRASPAVNELFARMTLVPEVNLAREAEICYLSIATVTDYDVWADHPVTSSEIIETLAKNVEKTKKLITELVPSIPIARNKCACGSALENALL